MEVEVFIGEDGVVQFVYADDLRPLLETGEARVERASHVEPTTDNKWRADMSPVGGPTLPATESREESLRAEREWLSERMRGGAL